MQDQLVTIALISLGVGIGLAILFLILLQLKRLNQQVNSLVDRDYLIGQTGLVQIPFDKSTKGKVRVNFQGNILDLVAITESDHHFQIGEAAFILQFKNNKVLVIPEKYLKSEDNNP